MDDDAKHDPRKTPEKFNEVSLPQAWARILDEDTNFSSKKYITGSLWMFQRKFHCKIAVFIGSASTALSS